MTFFHQLLLPYFLEPIDMIVRIIFDRVVSASIFISLSYLIIAPIRANDNIKNKFTPYPRHLIWATIPIGILLSKILLPMLIQSPLHSILINPFGIEYYHKLYTFISMVWLIIVLIKFYLCLKCRKAFINYLIVHPLNNQSSNSVKKFTFLSDFRDCYFDFCPDGLLETCLKIDNSLTFNKAYNISGIGKKVYLISSPKINSPASFGFRKKYILLPQNYKEKYIESELYNLFMHELMHIKRNDTSKNFFLEIFSIVLWINPLVNKIIQAYKNDCETLCDLAVLGCPYITAEDCGKLLIKELYNSNKVQFITGLNNDFNYMRIFIAQNTLIMLKGLLN